LDGVESSSRALDWAESDRIADVPPALHLPLSYSPATRRRVSTRSIGKRERAAVTRTDMVTISASVLGGALTTRAKVVLGWVRLFRELIIVWNINEFRVLVGLRYAVYKYYRYFRRF
jgi:hypothetical protein